MEELKKKFIFEVFSKVSYGDNHLVYALVGKNCHFLEKREVSGGNEHGDGWIRGNDGKDETHFGQRLNLNRDGNLKCSQLFYFSAFKY